MLTMFYWGKAADRYGRKPVLVISNLAVAVFVTLFGTSKTLWQMILWRSLMGFFTGSVISIRTMFHEISTPKNTARAFSYFAFAGNLGIFAGPAIGSLARPAEQYPNIFGKLQFFRDWPYILPTAIAGIVGFIAALTSFFFLEETLPEELSQNPDKPKMSTWELVKHPGVPSSILAFSWASMLGFGFTALAPVYFYTSVPRGGFGLSERLISLFISLNGIAQALWLLFAFPPLHKRLGTRRLLQGCGIFWGPFMLFFPINNWFLRNDWKAAFWAVAPLVQTIGSGVAIAFTACQLAVNEAAPSPDLLGTLNGVVLVIQPGIRAIAPSLFSSLHATGVKKHILGGQLGMLVLTVLAASYFFIASLLPKPEKKPALADDNHDEEITD